ncbi:MAG TPA: hypothetical protein DDX26_03150 [Candidatus Yonathbacteria bacterium]|uniref:Uncharacterized protein n=1 Tax=Candidatus Nomurabacteria bacterium GW2011_GWC2_42_20 TaxID=1618756 RepID=A0A0G0ZHQ5_9BACT|nr:MAG: hypothetical protein UV12_C0002G0096 [Candidatus Nomurabacteria bacterium GW2011_GWC2_42_20]KKT09820.1 MAG: hypothetical protein UV86_C0002G0063 [Candidatus Nomurabacteria bacterium GW2011_GWB1_43_20]TAN36283.1 MAG: hypothetical protein EPN27_02080 [Patescibacteria group bacterium]HBH71826.1 hypothetical protein [Candidatus Yonathbacteria bacterium]
MKKIVIFISLMATFFVFASFTHAQDYTPLAPLPGTFTGATGSETTNLSTYLGGMLKLLIALGAGVSILVAIIGGTQYVVAGIAPSAKQDAKERILNALIGLTLVLTSYLILNSINPGLVQFNFSLPPIGTSPAPTTAGGGVHIPLSLPTTPLVQPDVYGVAAPIDNNAAIVAANTQAQDQINALIDRNNDYSIISHCIMSTTYDLCAQTDLNGDGKTDTADVGLFRTKGYTFNVNQNTTLELVNDTPQSAKSCFFKISTANVRSLLPHPQQTQQEDIPAQTTPCGGPAGRVLMPTVACNGATWLRSTVLGSVCAADNGYLNMAFGFVWGADGVSPGEAGSDGQYSNFKTWVTSASNGSVVDLRTLLSKTFFNRQQAYDDGPPVQPYFENILGKITYATIAQYDLNDDGLADFGSAGADMAVFNSCKASPISGICAQADFNEDGTIDNRDLAFANDLFSGPGLAFGWKLDWFESRFFDTTGYSDKQIINYCIGHKAFENCGGSDFNGDGVVSAADLAVFNDLATQLDFNGDGIVNLQ